MAIRELMIDVEEAAEAARESVVDATSLSRQQAVRFSARRAADTIDLIAPATESIVDDINHGPAHPLERASQTLAPILCAGLRPSSLSTTAVLPGVPETHLQVGNKP
ncbi:hypothetical protein [Bradyrhizobium sp. I1.7.5]|uniref:hypothetical protein n=1 Tax=Bradyrhizobium sp. I1.7.5 TaxID=3156363 RepID=UPI00339742F5